MNIPEELKIKIRYGFIWNRIAFIKWALCLIEIMKQSRYYYLLKLNGHESSSNQNNDTNQSIKIEQFSNFSNEWIQSLKLIKMALFSHLRSRDMIMARKLRLEQIFCLILWNRQTCGFQERKNIVRFVAQHTFTHKPMRMKLVIYQIFR